MEEQPRFIQIYFYSEKEPLDNFLAHLKKWLNEYGVEDIQYAEDSEMTVMYKEWEMGLRVVKEKTFKSYVLTGKIKGIDARKLEKELVKKLQNHSFNTSWRNYERYPKSAIILFPHDVGFMYKKF